MNVNKDLLFEFTKVNVDFLNNSILKIRKLKFHRGAIYGITGAPGSGKTTILKLMSGLIKESSGEVRYDNSLFQKNWLGKIIQIPEIAYINALDNEHGNSLPSTIGNKPIKQVLSNYSKKLNIDRILQSKLTNLSNGEIAFVNLSIALEKDPRVLILDDYGIYFDNETELKFRKKIISMNKNFGTTVILSSINDRLLKLFSSVVVYLEYGHVSKIRTGIKSPKAHYKPRSKKFHQKRKDIAKKN